jgi:23S rRNA (uracil1939-C5)-methyltransferase
LSDDAYSEHKRQQVIRALNRRGVDAFVREPIRVPPRSRRRAVFKAKKSNGAVALGLHAASSHAIVDMRECLVLAPAVFEAGAGLRQMLNEILGEGGTAELQVTDTDTGPDIAIRWPRATTFALIATLSAWAAKLGVARLTSNGDLVVSVAAPTVRLADVEVELPPGSFLQPTREGEKALQDVVRSALSGATCVADLFSGCGTFALALARNSRVRAFDNDRAMLSALDRGARRMTGLKPVITERRDLFRRPLSALELAPFDGVVLDPPRAGAERQVRELAEARVPRIAYASCNAESFARDARILRDGGLRLPAVTPIDQFLWSDHIELVGVFERWSR